MKITYDQSVDVAYIQLADKKEGRLTTYDSESPENSRGDVNLDYDESGMLFGIEILNASQMLAVEVLQDTQND